jgi:transposase
MAKPLVSDELWELIRPLLPAHEPSPKGGRPRLQDRACLTGILFVLKTGIGWEALPAEMGCGSGMTCWRRLEEWRRAGVWDALHAALLAKLEAAGAIDWSRAAVDSSRVRAPLGGKKPGRTRPTAPSAAASTRC